MYDPHEDQLNILPSSSMGEQMNNKPVKRPLNAYNLYFIEKQPLMKEECPDLGGNDISHLIGKMWSELSEEEKRPYKEKAREIKEKFNLENPNYHYQKGGEKRKKNRNQRDDYLQLHQDNDLFNFISSNQITQPVLENQLHSFLVYVGSQTITHFAFQNKEIMEEFQQIKPQVNTNQPIEEQDFQ